MKAVATHVNNGLRMFMTEDGLSTDIPDNAHDFLGDLTMATMACIRANEDKAWSMWGIRWNPAMLLANGEVAELD